MAVIEQRFRLLKSRGIDPDEKFSWPDELRARNNLIDSIRHCSDQWELQAQKWWHIIVIRHINMLLEIRRKIYECAGILSADIDKHWHFSTPLSKHYGDIDNCFDIVDLHEQCLGILSNIAAAYIKHNDQFDPEHLLQHIHNPLIQQACTFAHDFFREDISLQHAADHLHVSAAHLARLCKKELGISYVHLLQHLRLHHACEKLLETDDGILQIALDSGFQSPKHFHRVFLKWLRLTPRQFRTQHHQN
jgi:AraC-like DNA-binding protein